MIHLNRFLILALGLISLSGCQLKSDAVLTNLSAGTVVRLDSFPSAYVPARNIDIWLPDAYAEDQQYAVLYMHDGQMLYDSTSTWNKQEWGVDETLSALMNKGQIQPVIVVGIWNSNFRHSEYFPQKPFESLLPEQQEAIYEQAENAEQKALFAKPVCSDAYLKFMVEELKPYVDANYPVYTDAAHTFVMGSSMGGLISLYALCEYPDVFGGAACLSTHWPGITTLENNPVPQAFYSYLGDYLPPVGSHKIYFDYGTVGLDASYGKLQAKVDSVMRSKQYTQAEWLTKPFLGADHSEKSWAARLKYPVKFLLGTKK